MSNSYVHVCFMVFIPLLYRRLVMNIQGGPKSKPLLSYQNIVLYRLSLRLGFFYKLKNQSSTIIVSADIKYFVRDL